MNYFVKESPEDRVEVVEEDRQLWQSPSVWNHNRHLSSHRDSFKLHPTPFFSFVPPDGEADTPWANTLPRGANPGSSKLSPKTLEPTRH